MFVSLAAPIHRHERWPLSQTPADPRPGQIARLRRPATRAPSCGGATRSSFVAVASASSTSDVSPTAAPKVLITGGYSGIGLETALQLARAGADVLIAGRDEEQAQRAAEDVRARAGDAAGPVSAARLDLSSLASVRAFCAEYVDSGRPLDVLVNNAGCMMTPFELTEDGLDRQFQVNHASHFLMTELLLERLNASPLGGRVINVSSIASYYSDIRTPDDFERAARPTPAQHGRWSHYCHSKLAQAMHAAELQRRLDATGSSVTINALHPGIIATRLLSRPWNWWYGAPFVVLFPLFLASGYIKTADKGARTPVYLASSPEVRGRGGRFFVDEAEREAAGPALDPALCAALCDYTAALVGL
eukprot:tig00000204_g17696.t1